MLSGDLVKRLILPLGLLAGASIIAAVFVPWQGLFISLATTFIGIILTVSYVNYVLRQHERQRWAPVDTIIRDYLRQFASVVVSQFRVVFGVGAEALYFQASNYEEAQARMRDVVIQLAEQVLTPMVVVHTINMDQHAWKRLDASLRTVVQYADSLVSLFGQRMEPAHLHLLLSIRNKAMGILMTYTILPDMLGVPDDELPQSTGVEEAATLKRQYTLRAADDIQETLSLSAGLLRAL